MHAKKHDFTLEEYKIFWKSHNILWRFSNVLRWRLGNLRAALFGGLTPGEHLLLNSFKEERAELQAEIDFYENILDRSADKIKPSWEISHLDKDDTDLEIDITVVEPE